MAWSATFHVNPASGSMSNPGTAAEPWSTLEAVFDANKTFAAGDEILLYSGYHGAPTVKGDNSATVRIRPAIGATPKLKNLIVRSGSRWEISGLDICPENQSPGTTHGSTMVEIEGSASHITLRDCVIRGSFSIEGWDFEDWDVVGRGIRTAAAHTLLEGNHIEAAVNTFTSLLPPISSRPLRPSVE